jgi:hypothetical protein
MKFTGTAAPLSEGGLHETLDLLKLGAAELWAVLAVETQGCGFLKDRRPLILFERHIFRKETNGAFDQTHPRVSALKPGGYLGGPAEYQRLEEAIALNSHAALNSASWGIGQIMGFNCKLAGFDSAEQMVAAMVDTEDAQLSGMANFVRSQDLHVPLGKHDWAGFARRYNGSDFAKNQYDVRLAASFQLFSSGVLPNLRVRQVQVLLTFLDFNPGVIDGISGKRTRSAIVSFREKFDLGNSDEIDAELIAAIQHRVADAAAASG